MGDLAQALMVLSREANGRRQARKMLREAVTTIAEAILGAGLRAGDSVTLVVPDGPVHNAYPLYQVVSVTWPISQWANDARSFLCPEPKNTLVLGSDAVLLDVREDYIDYDGGSNRHHPVGRSLVDAAHLGDPYPEADLGDLHLATDEELVKFCSEAEQVVTAFAKLLGDQGRSFTAAAERVTKLVPR